MTKKFGRRLAVVAATWLSACGPSSRRAAAPPHPAPVHEADAGQSPSRPDAAAEPQALPPLKPGDVDFATRPAPPADLRVDGNLEEWGPLVPKTKGASSHVALAFGADGLVVAGDVATSRRGIWLDLAGDHDPFPFPGLYDRGSGSMIPLDCDVVIPAPPEGGVLDFKDYKIGVVASSQPACRRVMEKAKTLREAYEAGFRRLLRLDSHGARRRDAAAGWAPVDGATASVVVRPDRFQFEISLPKSALPRLQEAPLRSMGIGVSDEPESSPPPNVDKRRERAYFDPPVAIEPGEALREVFFDTPPGVRTLPSVVRSYQPGEELSFEELSRSTEQGLPSVSTRRGLLAKPGGTVLGHVRLAPGDIADVLFVDGVPKDYFSGHVVKRGGRLHIIGKDVSLDPGSLKVMVQYSVAIIDADGHRTPVEIPDYFCDPWGKDPNCCYGQSQVSFDCKPRLIHNATWSQFGILADGYLNDGSVHVSSVRWTWSPRAGRYVMKTTPAVKRRSGRR